MKSSDNGYDRNSYGSVIFTGGDEPTNLTNGRKLLHAAIKRGLLKSEYIDTDKKGRGDCLNYDIYDVSRGAVLVQRRHTTIDKYGNHPQKSYYIVSKAGRSVVEVKDPEKRMIVKWSRRAKRPGDIIKATRGEIKISLALPVEYGYKAVTKDAAGRYVSVWDGSPWSLGVTRAERATCNHLGGFYYYKSLGAARNAAEANDIFGDARDHDNLHFLRVRIEGSRCQMYNGKYCASRITPIKKIA